MNFIHPFSGAGKKLISKIGVEAMNQGSIFGRSPFGCDIKPKRLIPAEQIAKPATMVGFFV
jgi:hypothetical protein